MKRNITIILLLFFAVSIHAQEREVHREPVSPSVIFSGGYLPQSTAQSFKLSATLNDVIIDRIGGYVSVEMNFDSGVFYNTYGVTGRIYKNIYLWAGVDLFSSNHGLLDNEGLDGTRKEIGVGYIFHPNIAAKLGYSGNQGVSLQVGWRIPLMWTQN